MNATRENSLAKLGKQSFHADPKEGKTVRTHSAPIFWRYIVAVICVLIAFVVRYWLTPFLGEELPFMLFVAAALVAAWYGGATTGVVALMLGLLLASHFFLTKKPAPNIRVSVEVIDFVRYLFTATLGIVLIEVLHRDRRALQQEIERRKRTEQALREAEVLLREHATELERRVAERTADLSKTLESLRAVLYQMAHSLRAPLRAMSGYTHILLNECSAKLDAPAQEHARHISAAAFRMDSLIHDLLEYGRLGYIEVDLEEVSLEATVERVLSQLGYEIQSRSAQVEVVRPLPPVLANAQLAEEALTYLVENALKFVAPGVAPRIRIWAERRQRTITLCVEDQGIGVEPQYHERIFNPFESLHPAGTYEGTGMGLAIVKQAMQRMNGRTGVTSKQGAGSLFWLEFQTQG